MLPMTGTVVGMEVVDYIIIGEGRCVSMKERVVL
jgi:DNA repair protein RadC